MKNNELTQLLDESDFHVDALGRVVIDNPELLSVVNGAMGNASDLAGFLSNGACANSGCS